MVIMITFYNEERTMSKKKTGQAPFEFSFCEGLRAVPSKALENEIGLHGGFAVDPREGQGDIYYGMAGIGLIKVSTDLEKQEILEISSDLMPLSFHSTKIGTFDGNPRIFLPANEDEKVVILTLEGDIDFILSKPEFDEYESRETPYRPTDTTLVGNTLYVADGYGANYISTVDLSSQSWSAIFGGKSHSAESRGVYGTAHGITQVPASRSLAIADRPHSRFEVVGLDGSFQKNYALPTGSRPCGINYYQRNGTWYAVVASLDDPQEGRAAPIYILNADTFQVISTIRPKEDLGIARADHIHNVIWHEHNNGLFLVCQSWNPGFYFVLGLDGP